MEPDSPCEAVAGVEALLDRLRKKLDGGITWELKRQLEVLVNGITVVNVRYKFVSSLILARACLQTHTCGNGLEVTPGA